MTATAQEQPTLTDAAVITAEPRPVPVSRTRSCLLTRSLFGHSKRAAGLVRNRVAATISQVPWRKTGQTNLVTPWKL